jgi:hypothetical protein
LNVEHAPYHLDASTEWPQDRPDQISHVNVPLLPASSLSRVTNDPSAFYPNSAGDDKWGRNDHSKVSPSHERRHEYSWSMSPTHMHAGSELGRTISNDRAFATALIPSELSSSSQRGNHRSVSSFEQFADRSRPRNLDTVDGDLEGRRGEYWYSGYGQIPGILDGVSQRLGWAPETEDRFRQNSTSRSGNHHQPSSNQATVAERYNSPQGYDELTYNHLWSPGSDSSSESHSPQQALFPPVSELSYFAPDGRYTATARY